MSALSVFGALIALTGVCLLGTAGYVTRVNTSSRTDESAPGTQALATFTVLLGIAGVGTGLLVAVGGIRANGAPTRDGTLWLTQFVELAALAWFVFALQYTGRGSLLTRRRLGLLVGAYAVLWVPLVIGGLSGVVWSVAVETLSVTTSLYGITLTLLAVTLLVQTVFRHGYLDSWIGVALAAVGFIPWLLSTLGLFAFVGSPPWLFGAVCAAGLLTCWLLLTVVARHPDTLGGTAATQAVGRQALVSQTDALVIIADASGRVVDANGHAGRALEVDRQDICGQRLSDVLETSIETLEETNTLELRTRLGVRQYDVEVLPLRTVGSTAVGWLVSLRDVTQRRHREQRLDVLNRILRHNIRNKLTVVKGRAKMAANQADEPDQASHLRAVLGAVDALDALSEKTGSFESTFDTAAEPKTADIAALVRSTVDELQSDSAVRETTVDSDGNTTIRTRATVLTLAVENALENALEHADAAVAVTITEDDGGVRIQIDDDGPGIPASEATAVSRGEETELEHGSGIGLWIIKWGTTACGGTTAFTDGPNGGRVELWIPDLTRAESDVSSAHSDYCGDFRDHVT